MTLIPKVHSFADSKYAIAVIEYQRYFKTEYMVIGLNDYIIDQIFHLQ